MKRLLCSLILSTFIATSSQALYFATNPVLSVLAGLGLSGSIIGYGFCDMEPSDARTNCRIHTSLLGGVFLLLDKESNQVAVKEISKETAELASMSKDERWTLNNNIDQINLAIQEASIEPNVEMKKKIFEDSMPEETYSAFKKLVNFAITATPN